MSKFNYNLRWVKKECLQKRIADRSKTLKRKLNAKKYDTNNTDSLSSIAGSSLTAKKYRVIKENRKLDDNIYAVNVKFQHKRNTKYVKSFALYSDVLKEFDNKLIDPSKINVNSIEDVSKLNYIKYSQNFGATVNNSKNNITNNNYCIIESWKEENYGEKVKLAWLSYVNSLTNEIPIINLHTLANPFMLIPIEICQKLNINNINMGEILCRKRTETAVIYWIISKLNRLRPFK